MRFRRRRREITFGKLKKPSLHLLVRNFQLAGPCDGYRRSKKRGFGCVLVLINVDLVRTLGHSKRVAPRDVVV